LVVVGIGLGKDYRIDIARKMSVDIDNTPDL